MSIDPRRALAVQHLVVRLLLLAFLALFGGVTAATVADTSAALLPTAFAGLVGVVGLGLLTAAFGSARRALAAPATPDVSRRAVRRAGASRAVLLSGAIGTVALGVALGLALDDLTLAGLALVSAVGPALAAMLAASAHARFLTLPAR
jgi:hypothetical protein